MDGNLRQRIDHLSTVGTWLTLREAPELNATIHRASIRNPWFTLESIDQSIKAICSQYLQKDKLQEFVSGYQVKPPLEPKRVALILAGNVPLVGFHDLLCVYLSGHQGLVKLSDKDDVLIPLIFNKIATLSGGFNSAFRWTERLLEFDAVIATGSNRSARQFEKYFSPYPHIIRKNRNGIAVLNGMESRQNINDLGEDIFQYFGLGCRSVSKIYVPQGYDFERLMTGLEKHSARALHPKYKNNFDYNFATLEINRIPYISNKCIILKEDQTLASRIATLHYSYYQDLAELSSELDAIRSSIQCLVGQVDLPGFEVAPFGSSQHPRVDQFADGVDTMKFLADLAI